MRFAPTARRSLSILLLVLTTAAIAPAHSIAQDQPDQRPCTAIVTPMISTFRFGSELALATGPALVPGLVGTGLALPGSPELSGQIQSLLSDTLYQPVFGSAGELRALVADQLDLLDELLSLLAINNQEVDESIERFAAILDQIATTYGDHIAPLDRTLTDLAASARYFSSGTCGT